jgi:L-histidine Nalpha-methyltransferase
MSGVVQVAIHPSQFPGSIRRDLLESLRTRQINHKFHYDSVKQTQRWLALHQAHSPSRTDPDCAGIYDQAFEVAAAWVEAPRVHMIGLGCGGGQKDTRLLKLLRDRRKEIRYTPIDASVTMVLVARQTALAVIDENACFPLVCDLASAEDLPAALASRSPANAAQLITFFGMIPNFRPQTILPRLSDLLRPADLLLLSANLAPGLDYASGIQRLLPQYDNPLTRDWLMTFLLDLGVDRGDGELRFVVEDDPAGGGLKRIVAHFHFGRPRGIEVDGEVLDFRAGESICLFFSYRHTPDRLCRLLAEHGITAFDRWITKSEEEGVFICRRT